MNLTVGIDENHHDHEHVIHEKDTTHHSFKTSSSSFPLAVLNMIRLNVIGKRNEIISPFGRRELFGLLARLGIQHMTQLTQIHYQ